jgi:excisionase family DNA binding protein
MDEMTVQQVADELGYTTGYVRKLVQRGKLDPSVHYAGQLLRFSSAEVARYAAERRPRGRPRKGEGDE